jgi:DNA-binding GntR family transcriptional regulator
MTAGAAGKGNPISAQSASSPAHALTPRAEADVEGTRAPVRAAGVLADRMAAALVHREPGWRLPRRSALARRYNVSLTEIDAAITDLARRSLVRRLPDGQLYRASPADYWIPIEGTGGLSTRLDPMGGAITCQSRHVSRRDAPQDVAWALGLPTGAPIRVVRSVWSAAGDPAAVSTAYLHDGPADDADPGEDPEAGEQFSSFGEVLNAMPAVAVSVEMSPPQPAVARSLRLSPGQPVTTVTIRFADSDTGAPGGLTVVMLKPELFRVAVDTAEASVTAPLSSRCRRVAAEAEPMPRRARYLIPRGLPRRGEIVAACAVLIVVAHVVFAQLTLVLAIIFWLVTKATRWRLSWLAAPAAVGAAWTLAEGPRVAAAGFADGPAKVIHYLGAGGHQLTHLVHFNAAFAGIGSWLPRQVPLAILAGSAEAALAGWVSWLHTDEWNVPPARPGLLAALRRAAIRRAIAAGGVVTRDGACLGVAAGSGAPVELSWSEAAGGVGVCGSAGADVLATSFQLVHAAVRRRKPVLAVDLTADPDVPRRLAALCAAAGTPLQVFGHAGPGQDLAGPRTGPACYEPFRHGDTARRAALVMSMINWEGPGSQYRRSCAAYLEDVFELLDVAPGDPRVPVLDEIIHLLNPSALRARTEHVPAGYPRRDVLAERTRVSASLLSAEPATTAQLARQLRELRASAFGRWLRPPGPGAAAGIDIGRTVTERGVVLFCLGGTPEHAPSAMLIRLVCQDLLASGEALYRMGVDGDAVVWLTECGSMPASSVTGLIARGPDTGLPVVAVTTAAPVAVELADLTNVLVVHRMDDAATARQLAAAAGCWDPGVSETGITGTGPASSGSPDDPASLPDGEFVLAVKDPPRLVPRAEAVPARIRRSPGGRA